MRAEKKYLIDEVETHLKKSDYVILANFTGVTVADAADLRAKLSVEKAEYHVVKNSSLRVAAKAVGDLYDCIAREGSAVSMLDKMQTRAELYEAIGYSEYEALDATISASIVPPDLSNKK